MGVSPELPPSRTLECEEERRGKSIDHSNGSSSDDNSGSNSNSSRRRRQTRRCLEKKSRGQKGSQHGCFFEIRNKEGCLDTHESRPSGRRCRNKENNSSSSRQNCGSIKERSKSSLSSCQILAKDCDTPVQEQRKRRKRKRGTKKLPSRETSSDENASVSSLNRNVLSRETSSDEGVSNNIIDLKKNVQICENATCTTTNDVEYIKLNQCIPEVKQESECLDPAMEFSRSVEGIIQDEIKLDLPTQTDRIHIEKSPSVGLEASSPLLPSSDLTKETCDSSINMEMTQENMMNKMVTPISGFKARKKRVVHRSPFQHSVGANNEKETSSSVLQTSQLQRWDEGILCDLCHRGPSLLLGGWFCVHCGSPIANCHCSQLKEHGDDVICGKVHKLCALWSSSTFMDTKGSIQGLLMVVKKGKLLKCAKCQINGATIACCINTCDQYFHYSCADLLASRLRCAMWKQENKFNLACNQHRFVARSSQKDIDALLNLKRRLKRIRIEPGSSQAHGKLLYKFQHVFTESDVLVAKGNETLIDISSDSEGENKTDGECDIQHWHNQVGSFIQMDPTDPRVSGHGGTLYCIGDNLLCTDISKGWEPVCVPCTNDVDSAPAPDINYINKSRCRANAKDFYKSLFLMKENISQPCKGCNHHDIDNPHKEASSHLVLKDSQRHTDTRVDWQGQPMSGLNPYDQYGRLQLGPEIDIVECNDRCPCEAECLNKELQKGLRLHLEVYRTQNQLWAVRTTEQIPRGKFVVEFAGEIVTHENAHKLRGEYELTKLSCFACKSRNLLMVDGHRMSNIARFIGRSSQGNLGIHRVYTETIDPRFYRMGLYAARDIEIGEELLLQVSDTPDCKLMSVCIPPTSRSSDELMYVAE